MHITMNHAGKVITSPEYEVCHDCRRITGNHGKDKDSLYDGKVGPLCRICYDRRQEEAAERKEKADEEKKKGGADQPPK